MGRRSADGSRVEKFERKNKRGRGLGFGSGAYDRACAYRMPWESAICTPYPLGYVVVLIKTRSPTTMVVPPVPTNWALFVFQLPDVRDERSEELTSVLPSRAHIVCRTVDVVS